MSNVPGTTGELLRVGRPAREGGPSARLRGRVRKVEIPKGDHKVRVLSIPVIRDRVVQGALKLILEPILRRTFNRGRLAIA